MPRQELVIPGVTHAPRELEALLRPMLIFLRGRPGRMVVDEDHGRWLKTLDMPDYTAVLVKVDGIIRWWPESDRERLSPDAEILLALDGTPKWVKVEVWRRGLVDGD